MRLYNSTIDHNTASGNLTGLRSSHSISPCEQGEDIGTLLYNVGIDSLPIPVGSRGFKRIQY